MLFPVQYTYDTQGRLTTMKTWQNAASGAGAATTTWSYDASRGFLSKNGSVLMISYFPFLPWRH